MQIELQNVKMKCLHLLLLVCVSIGTFAQDTIYFDEKELVQHLLDDYDFRARPVLNSADPVNVKFGITPIQISDMDEVNQVLAVNVWLQHIWVDERLRWDPQKYNNLSKLRIPQEAIWLPDIVLYNSAEDYTETMKTKLTVENDGTVFWGPPTRFRASCKIVVTYFPFDEQSCALKFSSWMYDGNQLNLSVADYQVDMKEYLPNGEWKLLNITMFRSSVKYDCCPEPYPFVTYRVVIKRRVLYYMFNIIFPCLWLAILSVMTFWLPPDSGEKITLGITVLLAFSVFMLLVAESMPKTSESVPLIGIYLTITMSLTSMSILLTIIILQIHHVGPRQRKMPTWLRTFAFRHLARVLCVRGIVHNFVEDERDDTRFLYPRPARQLSNPNIISNYILELASKLAPETNATTNGGEKKKSNSAATLATLAQLEALITKEMQRNASDRREEDEQKAIGDEWRLLAIILDRLFFWIYILVTAATTFGILVVMPISGSWSDEPVEES